MQFTEIKIFIPQGYEEIAVHNALESVIKAYRKDELINVRNEKETLILENIKQIIKKNVEEKNDNH